ncbi:MAG: protease modulator HflC [Rickettsiales bacterium]|nr:protease modulator HflC [Rickettsiales bacterium]MCA0254319.1 protease modulator HflC [Pseudomonadota bacterium]
MINKLYIGIISIFITIIIMSGALFTVDQRETAVVFQFGEAVRVVDTPGLKVKVPFIQDVQFLDKRILNVSAEEKELTASDEKRLIVDAFAKYKIIEPVMFIKTVHNYSGANLRLNKILESAMRTVIGRYPLNTLLTEQRSILMQQIRDLVHKEAALFGIKILDVRILKSDLPTENSDAIYQRMKTERHKEAKQIRAEGAEEAARIKARADKENKVILATAYMDAQKIKGEGDSEAAKLYNASYSKDWEFYNFYRSLIAYRAALNKDNTQFVLSPKAEFFKHLQVGK